MQQHSYGTRSQTQFHSSSEWSASLRHRPSLYRRGNVFPEEEFPIQASQPSSQGSLVHQPPADGCVQHGELTIQGLLREAGPQVDQSQSQPLLNSPDRTKYRERAYQITKYAAVLLLFVTLGYGMILCERIHMAQQLNIIKTKMCKLEEDTNKRLDDEINARQCLELKEKEDVGEIREDIEEIHVNLKNLSMQIASAVEAIKSEVSASITTYDADKNGLPDYALESSGGAIASVRQGETYTLAPTSYILGIIPMCQPYRTPTTIINPSVYPGECWAFEGSRATVVIQLIGRVRITAVSLEHLARLLSPTGDILTAPKDFAILGLADADATKGFLFGQFQYDKAGPPLQYFEVLHTSNTSFNFVEFRVASNHGHPDYTCVYRLRVHGNLTQT